MWGKLISLVTIATLILVAPAVDAEEPDLQIDLEVPEVVRPDELFEVRIVVSNSGEEPFVFKRHWKWAENTWYFEAQDSTGETTKSTPALFDIAADSMCLHFIPMYPGDTFSTTTVINHTFVPEGDWPPEGAEHLPTELSFDKQIGFAHPGNYRLRLVYVSEHRPREDHCASGGCPIWTGKLESTWANFKVEGK